MWWSIAFAGSTGTLVAPTPWPGPVPQEVAATVIPAGWTAALIGEVTRGTRTVVVVWPGFKGDVMVDDDVVGFAFDRTGDRWVAGDANFGLSHSTGPAKLREVLGGDDWVVARTCGAPIAELGPKLVAAGKRFVAAADGHDPKGAMAAFVDYAALVDFGSVGLSDAAIESMRTLSTTELTCAGSGCAPFPTGGPQVPVKPCGGGSVVSFTGP